MNANTPDKTRSGTSFAEKLAMLPASLRFHERLEAEYRFIREWIREPGAVGSVAPTGKATARAMASHAPLDNPLPVLELGPGTGAVTAAILAHGVAADRLVGVEYSKKFHTYLTERFPDVHFVHGDAFNLAATLAGTPWRRFSAVISALPLLNFPKPARLKLIVDALALCEPGAPFAQLCYGPRAPVPAGQGGLIVESSDWVVKNVPPARVFVYRKSNLF
ncbi:MAG: methyltransferase domain-containing protein [Salaquimonas sp.]|nr:methyltransferase domain-containing protein [Salaquimonas sp.]